jgi:putative transposase
LDVKKRFSEEQIIGFLREAEAGMAVKDLCRKHGFSEASYYLWRSKFGGLSVPEAKRLKELETEWNKGRNYPLESSVFLHQRGPPGRARSGSAASNVRQAGGRRGARTGHSS